MMNRIRIETIVEADGELHLSDLPCHKGDRIEAVISVHEQSVHPAPREASASPGKQFVDKWTGVIQGAVVNGWRDAKVAHLRGKHA